MTGKGMDELCKAIIWTGLKRLPLDIVKFIGWLMLWPISGIFYLPLGFGICVTLLGAAIGGTCNAIIVKLRAAQRWLSKTLW